MLAEVVTPCAALYFREAQVVAAIVAVTRASGGGSAAHPGVAVRQQTLASSGSNNGSSRRRLALASDLGGRSTAARAGKQLQETYTWEQQC